MERRESGSGCVSFVGKEKVARELGAVTAWGEREEKKQAGKGNGIS